MSLWIILLSLEPVKKPHSCVFSMHPILSRWILNERMGVNLATSITLTQPRSLAAQRRVPYLLNLRQLVGPSKMALPEICSPQMQLIFIPNASNPFVEQSKQLQQKSSIKSSTYNILSASTLRTFLYSLLSSSAFSLIQSQSFAKVWTGRGLSWLTGCEKERHFFFQASSSMWLDVLVESEGLCDLLEMAEKVSRLRCRLGMRRSMASGLLVPIQLLWIQR